MKSASAIITIYSGRHVDLLQPQAADISIDDIAAALCTLARFTGHTARRYTVAEHLLLGLDVCPPPARFHWFLHDFAEAYLGDVTGPLKQSIAMGAYRELEQAWEHAIAERFGVLGRATREIARQVRVVDARMLLTEQRDLKGRMPLSSDRYRPYALHIGPREPSADWLQQNFLATFYALAKETDGAQV